MLLLVSSSQFQNIQPNLFSIRTSYLFSRIVVMLQNLHKYYASRIESLGGPAKVCELLGYEKDGGVQRVQNWTTRGIPSDVKLKFPEIFLPELMGSHKEAA